MSKIALFIIVILLVMTGSAIALQVTHYTKTEGQIQSDQVYDVFFYDTSNDNIPDTWRTDNTKSWYNEPSNPSDDFTGSLDANRWEQNGNTIVDSGYVEFYGLISGLTWYGGEINSDNEWKLTGDFDIQISYKDFVSENNGELRFEIKDKGYPQNYYLFVQRAKKGDGSNVYSRNDYNNNYSEVAVSDTTTTGRLRIVRIGNNVTTYYGYWDAGTGVDQDRWKWTAVGSATNFGSYDIYIRCFTHGSSGVEVNVKIDDFIADSYGSCNLGNVGSHTRSTTNAFPEQAILVATEKGLDIIDASDNTLWMRYKSYDATPDDAKNQNTIADRLHTIFALDGNIYCGAYDGFMSGVGVIDFDQDESLFYDAHIEDGTGWDFLGNISERNKHRGWTDNGSDYVSILGWQVFDLYAKVINNGREEKTYVAVANGQCASLNPAEQFGAAVVINIEDNSVSFDKINQLHPVIGIDIGENNYLYYLETGRIYVEYSDFLNAAEFNADASSTVAIPTGLDACDLVTTSDYLYISEKSTDAPYTAGKTRKHNLNDVSYTGIKYEHWGGASLYLWGSSSCSALETNDNALWVATNHSTEGRIYIIGAESPRQDSIRGDFNIPSPLESGHISSMSFGATNNYPENLIVGYDSMGVTRLYGGESALSLQNPIEGEIQHNFSSEDWVRGDPFTYDYDSLSITIDPLNTGTYGNVSVILHNGDPVCPYPEHTLDRWYEIKAEEGFTAFPCDVSVQFTSPIPAGTDNLQLWSYSDEEEEWIPDDIDDEVTVNNWDFISSTYSVNYDTHHFSPWAMNDGSGGALAYPPKIPENLIITTNGSNAILIWNKVTENTFGDPITDVIYNIYNAYFPYFTTDSTYYFSTVSDTTFTDENALQNEKLFYKIRADK